MRGKGKRYFFLVFVLVGVAISGIGMHQANMAKNVSRFVFEAAHKHNWFWADGWFELFMRLSRQTTGITANKNQSILTSFFKASKEMTDCFSTLRNPATRGLTANLARIFGVSGKHAKQIIWITKSYSWVFWEFPAMMDATDNGSIYSGQIIDLLSQKNWYEHHHDFRIIYDNMKEKEELYSDFSYKISEKADRLHLLFFCFFCFSVSALFLYIIRNNHLKSRNKLEIANLILQGKENSLQRAQSIAKIGSWEWNLKEDSYIFSAEVCRILEIDPSDQSSGIWEIMEQIVHPDDRGGLTTQVKELWLNGNGENLTIRITNKNGEVRWIDAMPPEIKEATDDDSPSSIIGTVQDITGIKQAEEALLASEERYRTLFETMIQGVVYQDANGQIIAANPSSEKILGLSFDQMRGRTSVDPRWKSIHEDGSDFPGETHPSMVALKTGEQEKDIVMGVFNPSIEDYTWININAVPQFREGDKNPYQVYTTFHDITERKRAEAALRESEEKYRILFEIESDVIMLLRKNDGQILEINEASSSLYGYTREELLNMKVMDLSAEPEETRKAVLEDIEKIPIRYHQKKDGTVFPVEISGTKLKWKGKAARIATVRDISDRVEAEKQKAAFEEQLRQAHKMEAIGTLAGGIAHDFNNILGIMIGNTELAMDDVPEWNPARSNLEEIKKAGLRAKDVIRQLLSFSRKSGHERKPIETAPLIKESIRFLRSSIPSSIEIRQNITAVADVISGDSTQIHQVMINLCTNAAHAMEEEGGIMEISLTNIQLNASDVKRHQDLKAGPHVILSVSDTGCGIEPDIKDRLFDPYFTTKEVDKGTGMGLAVVHGIVKTHEGDISIESEPGKGTVVHVLFPALETTGKVNVPEAPETLQGENERILFIDDEPAITKMGQQMFERLGYECESRTSPVEALELFRSDPTQFDLIVTDMTMPQMTGERFAEAVIRIRPDIPIILCTGYSEKVDEKSAREMGIAAFTLKPITMRDIAHTIREVLDKW